MSTTTEIVDLREEGVQAGLSLEHLIELAVSTRIPEICRQRAEDAVLERLAGLDTNWWSRLSETHRAAVKCIVARERA